MPNPQSPEGPQPPDNGDQEQPVSEGGNPRRGGPSRSRVNPPDREMNAEEREQAMEKLQELRQVVEEEGMGDAFDELASMDSKILSGEQLDAAKMRRYAEIEEQFNQNPRTREAYASLRQYGEERMERGRAEDEAETGRTEQEPEPEPLDPDESEEQRAARLTREVEESIRQAQEAAEDARRNPLDVDKQREASDALRKAQAKHDEHEVHHISGGDPAWSYALKGLGIFFYVCVAAQWGAAEFAYSFGKGQKS